VSRAIGSGEISMDKEAARWERPESPERWRRDHVVAGRAAGKTDMRRRYAQG